MNTYYLYLIGQANSLVINQMLKFALYMYILDNTGSSVIYSNIIAFSMLPIIFFSPIAGWICDYVKKKKLIVMLDFTSGIILSLFFLLSNKVIAICIILFILKEYVSNNKRATIHLYEKKKMNNGRVAEIIKMSSCRNITVQFEDGEIVYHKCYQSFVKGNISHPKDTSLAKKNQRLNIRKQMKNGMMAEVIEYNLINDIKVKFDNGEIVKTRWERFSTGSVAVPSCYARNHIGDKKIQNRGNEEAEIIEVKDANHITVKFKDGTIVKDRKYEDFIHGAIGKPGIPQLRRTLKNERLWTEKIMRNP